MNRNEFQNKSQKFWLLKKESVVLYFVDIIFRIFTYNEIIHTNHVFHT